MEGNAALTARMKAAGLTWQHLAQLVNVEIEQLTGTPGTTSVRNVANWVSGKTRWPRSRQRAALEAVFGSPATELGFTPPRPGTTLANHPGPRPEESPLHRRAFLTASTGTATAVATAAAAAAPGRIGTTEVKRLAGHLADLVAADDRHGGTTDQEQRAVTLAAHTLALQQRGTASQRVREQLYALAAGFASSAMWAAADGRRFRAALGHLDRAVALADLSRNSAMRFRVWGHAGALYRQLGRPVDSLAAQDVARGTAATRRDPLFASLAHARSAIAHAALGNAAATRRSLGAAQDAYARAAARNAPRPVWMDFYDRAELEGLAGLAYSHLGQWSRAEAHTHHSLTLRRTDHARNRHLALTDLAHAQLAQGELEPAVATARLIPADAWRGRVGHRITDFSTALRTTHPRAAAAREWAAYIHDAPAGPA